MGIFCVPVELGLVWRCSHLHFASCVCAASVEIAVKFFAVY